LHHHREPAVWLVVVRCGCGFMFAKQVSARTTQRTAKRVFRVPSIQGVSLG
jgi:hypothetical protein